MSQLLAANATVNYVIRVSDHYVAIVTDDYIVHFIEVIGFGKNYKYLGSYTLNYNGRTLRNGRCTDVLYNQER